MKLFIGIAVLCTLAFAPLVFAQGPNAKNLGKQVKDLQMEKKTKKKAIQVETKMKKKVLKMETKAAKGKVKAEMKMTATSTPSNLGMKIKALQMEAKGKKKEIQTEAKAKNRALQEETKIKREELQAKPQQPATTTPQTVAPSQQQVPAGTSSPLASVPAPSEVTVTYTDAGFSPSSVTVNVGTKVRFVNSSSSGMWVASAMHPTHQLYPEFDQKSTGSEYMFEFTKVGSWNYHNHVEPSKFGTVIVQ